MVLAAEVDWQVGLQVHSQVVFQPAVHLPASDHLVREVQRRDQHFDLNHPMKDLEWLGAPFLCFLQASASLVEQLDADLSQGLGQLVPGQSQRQVQPYCLASEVRVGDRTPHMEGRTGHSMVHSCSHPMLDRC